jgi:hypothetical protein
MERTAKPVEQQRLRVRETEVRVHRPGLMAVAEPEEQVLQVERVPVDLLVVRLVAYTEQPEQTVVRVQAVPAEQPDGEHLPVELVEPVPAALHHQMPMQAQQ